ncbi:hypothetical protein [Stieleria varia]|uniref:Uncharacterized protein n=1 Tax=Stieleria varia TaxID=2528005 RepID=A0A5C6A0L6_9BACT|nr:hypothetical protein [Stieleria varia]TWT92083.1 hypothetical protein Pla52n_63800 [Stieleria varia]
MNEFTDAELIAFLDEALLPERASELESLLRSDSSLRSRLIEVRGRENAGLHTIGAIWRRSRLSCPSRDELGQYLLGTLDDEPAEYIEFHLHQIGCRYCSANLDDLRSDQDAAAAASTRRRRYFQTSAGYLQGRPDA